MAYGELNGRVTSKGNGCDPNIYRARANVSKTAGDRGSVSKDNQ